MKNHNSKFKITLLIDSADNKEIKAGLRINSEEFWIKKKHKKAQIVLRLVNMILKKHHLKISDLSAIKVNTGPGSFTGLRVGISVANALGFALNIPVNGKPAGQVHPIYEK